MNKLDKAELLEKTIECTNYIAQRKGNVRKA